MSSGVILGVVSCNQSPVLCLQAIAMLRSRGTLPIMSALWTGAALMVVARYLHVVVTVAVVVVVVMMVLLVVVVVL